MRKQTIAFMFSALLGMGSIVDAANSTQNSVNEVKENGKISAQISATEALNLLKQGNQRFVSGNLIHKDLLQERAALTKEQTPYAAVLCCSDSRVPPELIFDESLGRLFIIRVAGNDVDPVTLGSIEYAVLVLKVPLVVILGHDSCGVIEAALKGEKGIPFFIEALVRRARVPAELAREKSMDFKEQLRIAVVKNVTTQMEDALRESQILANALKAKQILLQGAVYRFDNGTVEFCPCKF
jgi:carbonic anhydrase